MQDNGLPNRPILLVEAHRGDHGVWRIKFSYDDLGSVENQDSLCGLVVIQALDGTIRTDRRPMGEDGTALSG
jgi:hypothetical protein